MGRNHRKRASRARRRSRRRRRLPFDTAAFQQEILRGTLMVGDPARTDLTWRACNGAGIQTRGNLPKLLRDLEFQAKSFQWVPDHRDLCVELLLKSALEDGRVAEDYLRLFTALHHEAVRWGARTSVVAAGSPGQDWQAFCQAWGWRPEWVPTWSDVEAYCSDPAAFDMG